ncbi:uncharacterized protein F5891DRAFT_898660, partial [Suillus fuscotomentosus]
YDPEELRFLDETSKDERTTSRRFERSKKGKRAAKKGVFVRGHHLSALGLLTIDGMMICSVIEGSFTVEKFKVFLQEDIVSAI